MHDPMTVIYQNKFFILWHVDPERDGTDDSCGWWLPKLTREERAYADNLILNEDDNIKHMFREDAGYDMVRYVARIFRLHKGFLRPWWKRPKYHIHHWKLQILFTEKLKRYLFSRCSECGKRFRWGYYPVSGSWHGTGPRWFRGEKNVRHHSCDNPVGHNENIHEVLNR